MALAERTLHFPYFPYGKCKVESQRGSVRITFLVVIILLYLQGLLDAAESSFCCRFHNTCLLACCLCLLASGLMHASADVDAVSWRSVREPVDWRSNKVPFILVGISGPKNQGL